MNKLKLITSVLGILLCISYSKAQETSNESSESKFSFGLKFGASFSSFTHDLEPFTDKKAGLVAGGFAEYRFYDFLGVSIEPVYLQKGALNVNPYFLYDNLDDYSPYTIIQVDKVTSHHLQVPLIINLRLPVKTSQVVPFLSLGGAVAYTLNVTATNLMDYGTMNGQKYYETMKEGITSQFEEWEYQVLIGPGLEFESPVGNILLKLDYYLGLSKINKYKYQYQYYNYSSNSWIFTLGYRFK
jgi:hypothetical protein